MQIRDYLIKYVLICINFQFINLNIGGGGGLVMKYNKNLQNIDRNKTVKLKEVEISCSVQEKKYFEKTDGNTSV